MVCVSKAIFNIKQIWYSNKTDIKIYLLWLAYLLYVDDNLFKALNYIAFTNH